MSDDSINPPQDYTASVPTPAQDDDKAALDSVNPPADLATTTVDLQTPSTAKTLGTDKFSTKLLSCPPIQLEWKNLNYKVKVPGKFPHCWTRATTKPTLQNLNGYVAPGEVLAIMGPRYV